MTTMGFQPAEALKERIAPTEKRDGRWLIGEVHDPRAYLLGGVAGHAGLFTTADDLAVLRPDAARRRPVEGQAHVQRRDGETADDAA